MILKSAALLNEQKRIIVDPGEKFSAGCKPGHGWLRVIDSAGGSRFYKMPIQNGKLHESVAQILHEIARETEEGHQSIFYWHRAAGGRVKWINEGAWERQQKALDEEFGGIYD